AVEGRCRDDHVKVTALARARVAGVLRAVVADLEQRGIQRLQRRAQLVDARGVHVLVSLRNSGNRIQAMTPKETTMATGPAIHTLNVTQSDSLRFIATQMFTKPSAA